MCTYQADQHAELSEDHPAHAHQLCLFEIESPATVSEDLLVSPAFRVAIAEAQHPLQDVRNARTEDVLNDLRKSSRWTQSALSQPQRREASTFTWNLKFA